MSFYGDVNSLEQDEAKEILTRLQGRRAFLQLYGSETELRELDEKESAIRAVAYPEAASSESPENKSSGDTTNKELNANENKETPASASASSSNESNKSSKGSK